MSRYRLRSMWRPPRSYDGTRFDPVRFTTPPPPCLFCSDLDPGELAALNEQMVRSGLPEVTDVCPECGARMRAVTETGDTDG